MNDLIKNIENVISSNNFKYVLRSNKLTTNIYATSSIFNKELTDFSIAFNSLFNCTSDLNIINNYIIYNDEIFNLAEIVLKDESLITTKALDEFNVATRTTSKAKCDLAKNFYIMKCYDYFIYIFDKTYKRAFMIIKDDIKVLTMINILILTPYLMYGELFAVHGGLVNKGIKNILINNASLGGKTTFALLFASNGWDIITEETTYITSSGEILPFNIRNYFNIRVGTYLNFLDFFKSKGIIFKDFINMSDLSSEELFSIGKEGQKSIDFEQIGVFKTLDNKYITNSLKVSISKDDKFQIKKCSMLENVNAFLHLSLAPTVMLFTELLDYYDVDRITRKQQLMKIFENTKSCEINSAFDYKEHFNDILNNM
ncbi:MAG: hypothetical protein IKX00_01560 [Bacilli bacterium]|nr:hypothetical protein [Bacilli bacterium]